MARTIQKQEAATSPALRRAFLHHAASLYGLRLDDDELEALSRLDDRSAVVGAFPQLSDAEVSEALWALGRFS